MLTPLILPYGVTSEKKKSAAFAILLPTPDRAKAVEFGTIKNHRRYQMKRLLLILA